MEKLKKIGNISFAHPFKDRFDWNGTTYKIRESIEKAGYEVVWIPLNAKGFFFKVSKAIRAILQLITRKPWLTGCHFPLDAMLTGLSIDKALVSKCDYLFFPGGAQYINYRNIDKPFIYYTDASIFGLIDYYIHGYSKYSYRIAEKLEMKAVQHARINIRSSKWAAESVVNDCGGDSTHNYVLEFGPNIDTNDIKKVEPYHGGELRILFSGVDWERKGGETAFNTVKLLRDKGINAHLFIVGIRNLDKKYQCEYVTNMGFLNKNNAEQYAQYIRILEKCHIFLLPTKAECSAIVLSEAAAFGMPCYTYATGGITNYVIDGYNGRTLSPGSSSNDFANIIIEDINNNRLKEFSDNDNELTRDKLSWEAWSRRFKAIMDKEGLS